MSTKILVGNTGLVGQTLKENIKFDLEFNSKNINLFENSVKDGCELWLSCLPATKWMVNKNLNQDIENIMSIINIIKHKTYSRVILISTIDVYSDSPMLSNEDYKPNFGGLSYGSNRLLFEYLVDKFLTKDDYKVYRLPALFNNKIKKNILFDLINNNNVESINRNSYFQWYNLDNLHTFILETYKTQRSVFNLFTEPLRTLEIIELFPQYSNKIPYISGGVVYDYKTNLTESGYIQTAEEVLKEIKKLVDEFGGK
jgi:hypothetical protein